MPSGNTETCFKDTQQSRKILSYYSKIGSTAYKHNIIKILWHRMLSLISFFNLYFRFQLRLEKSRKDKIMQKGGNYLI